MLKPVFGHGVLTIKVTVHRHYCTKRRLNWLLAPIYCPWFVHLSATRNRLPTVCTPRLWSPFSVSCKLRNKQDQHVFVKGYLSAIKTLIITWLNETVVAVSCSSPHKLHSEDLFRSVNLWLIEYHHAVNNTTLWKSLFWVLSLLNLQTVLLQLDTV